MSTIMKTKEWVNGVQKIHRILGITVHIIVSEWKSFEDLSKVNTSSFELISDFWLMNVYEFKKKMMQTMLSNDYLFRNQQ